MSAIVLTLLENVYLPSPSLSLSSALSLSFSHAFAFSGDFSFGGTSKYPWQTKFYGWPKIGKTISITIVEQHKSDPKNVKRV